MSERQASAADFAACEQLLVGGSRSFFWASLLLPARLRQAAAALYAFCRLADDAVDQGGGLAGLAEFRERLECIYSTGEPASPTDRAFARVVEEFHIPRELPEALLEGLAWDIEGRRYENLSDLTAYATRVAGTVGAMMALLMGRRDAPALERAVELGIAMQLTNIARDVGEDARLGRIYLPRDWLGEAGIDADIEPSDLRHSPALASVTERLLAVAEVLYQRAARGIGALNWYYRPAMHAARLLYREIGLEVARHGHNSSDRRAIVPPLRKTECVLRAGLAALRATPPEGFEVPAEARFLIDAAASRAAAVASQSALERWTRALDERAGWTIDLFIRVEQRQQAGLVRTGRPTSLRRRSR